MVAFVIDSHGLMFQLFIWNKEFAGLYSCYITNTGSNDKTENWSYQGI